MSLRRRARPSGTRQRQRCLAPKHAQSWYPSSFVVIIVVVSRITLFMVFVFLLGFLLHSLLATLSSSITSRSARRVCWLSPIHTSCVCFAQAENIFVELSMLRLMRELLKIFFFFQLFNLKPVHEPTCIHTHTRTQHIQLKLDAKSFTIHKVPVPLSAVDGVVLGPGAST